ncbi:MAG: hypothetical protein S4CHLAM6_01240 [Chlamydiae bacterium]|nr:hypothetical protein [Chlamydiota bacterium]
MKMFDEGIDTAEVYQHYTNTWEVWKYPLTTFVISFFLLFPLAFLSIDVTDTGFHLTNQMLANEIGRSYYKFNPFFPLSDLIAGKWLLLTSSLGLIGAKLGGIFAFAISAGISVKILQEYTRDRVFLMRSAFAALLLSNCVLSDTVHYMLLNYYTVPMVLGMLYILVSVSFIKDPRVSKALFLGAFLPVLFFARFTLILMGLIPVMTYWIVENKHKRLVWLLFFVSALTFWLIAGFFGENYLGVFHAIKASFGALDYSACMSVPKVYLRTLKGSLKFVAVVILLAAPIRLFFKRKFSENVIIIILSLPFIAVFLPSHYSVTWSRSFARKWHSCVYPLQKLMYLQTLFLTLFSLLIIYLCIQMFKAYSKSENKRELVEKFFIFISSLIFCASFLGSETGLVKSSYALWLLIGLGAVVSNMNTIHKRFYNKLIIFLSVGCLVIQYTHFYRDNLFPFNKLAVAKHGKFKGTITTKSRQVALDELVQVVQANTTNRSYILAYPSIPMICYATGNLSFVERCWIKICSTSVLEKGLDDSLQMKDLALMVKQKYHQNDHLWTMDNKSYDKVEDTKSRIVEDKVARSYKFNLIWENALFEVYRPEKKH